MRIALNDVLLPESTLNFDHVSSQAPAKNNLSVLKAQYQLQEAEQKIAQKKPGMLESWLNYWHQAPAKTQADINKEALTSCLKQAQEKVHANEKSLEVATSILQQKESAAKNFQERITMARQLKVELEKNVAQLQTKISENINSIQKIESFLASGQTKVLLSIETVKKIDPSLVKLEYDPKVHTMDSVVLQRDTFIDAEKALLKASNTLELKMPFTPEETLKKWTVLTEEKAKLDAFKKSVNIENPTQAEINTSNKLGETFLTAKKDYEQSKAQNQDTVIKKQAALDFKNYYESNWSQHSPEDIRRAKQCSQLRKDNIAMTEEIGELNKSIALLDQKKLDEALSDIEVQIGAQKTLVTQMSEALTELKMQVVWFEEAASPPTPVQISQATDIAPVVITEVLS